jgi:SP family myo-inositol transporter-like MFS transporter 13
LLFHNRRDECESVIRRIYPNATESQVKEKVLAIEYGVTEAKALNEEISIKASLGMLFGIAANRRAGIAACGLMFFQQFCG